MPGVTGDLKPYPAMKDSGVPWLEQVPTHWEVRRLSQIGRLSKGSGGSKEDEVPLGVPCVRYGDLYTTHTYSILKSRSFVSKAKVAEYTPICFGDVLFAASGETIDEIGKSAVNLIESEACCGGDVILFRPKFQIEARYMGYAADCRPAAIQKAAMGRGITVQHIYGGQLKYMTLALPPLSEQTAIVQFLDHADGRIQRYIRAKQKLITLLEEQKQAIIRQAVTGQIDIRTGQPYPTYKPSGVEWLGQVPNHWEVWRSKRAFTPRKELARPNDLQLSATQTYGVIAQENYERRVGRKVVKILRHLEKRRHVEVDDFVISMRSFQGGLERAWASGCIRSSYIVLRSATSLDVGYFGYLFKSISYINALQSTANFIRDGQDLNFENFGEVNLPFPPTKEQRWIARTLDDTTGDITTAIERYRRQINLVGEYRTRLIADVVTGKLDVREAAAALPEVDPLSVEDGLENTLDADAESDLHKLDAIPEEVEA